MRLGLIADAHGNPLGLDLCIKALVREGVDEIRFLGDAVGYMPGGPDVLDVLAARGVICQKGNHEAMLLGDLPLTSELDRVYRLRDTRRRLGKAQVDWLTLWPTKSESSMGGRRVLMVHGSPYAPLTDYIYPDSPLTGYAELGFDAVFMANTHRPFVRRVGPTVIANVGSCGLPRDRGDHASCVVYDSVHEDAELIRVPMSPVAVLAQFRTASLPPIVETTLGRRTYPFAGRIVEAA